MTNVSLMKVESIAECSPYLFIWSILQYFWPAFNDNLYESGHFKQVLL